MPARAALMYLGSIDAILFAAVRRGYLILAQSPLPSYGARPAMHVPPQ